MHHYPGSAAIPGWSTLFLAYCYQVVYFFSSVSFLSGLVFFKRRWSGFFPALAYFFLDVCTLIPCDDEGKEIIDGDVMAQCKSIKVVLVTEVSNHYE